jgi:hypothetical protein
MSPSEPETEIAPCPACRHLTRVPIDWLGQPVRCPQCRAMFKAPARDGAGGLTDPELLSRPPAPDRPPRAMDPMLLLPAFGLMFLGFAGLVVNGWLGYRFLTDPVGGREYIRAQLPELRKAGFGADDPPAEQDRRDDDRAARWAGAMRWVLPGMAAVSGLAFLGGLSIALRWNYRLAQAGCVAAGLNVVGLCCIPGAIAGVWGLLMLNSDEGRAHFRG